MKKTSYFLSCWRTRSRLLAHLTFLIWLAGCSSIPEFGAVVSDAISNDTYNINVQLQTSASLNPNNNGRPSPLYIKIFQLKDESAFQKLTLDELLFLEKNSFASHDILTVDDATLLPATTKTLELAINSDATYLGVLAAFQHETGKFKEAIKVKGKWNRDLCISLAESDIESADLC